MIIRWCIPLLALLACSASGNGTAVGNPGEMDVVLVNVPPDVELQRADFAVAAIELVSCDDRLQVLPVDTVFDTLRPTPIEVPPGEWCNTIVLPAGKDSLVLEGQDASGDFEFSLSPEAFALEGAYEIDGNTVLLTLAVQGEMLPVVDSDTGTPESAPDRFESRFEGEGAIVAEGLYVDDNADYLANDDELAAVVAETGGCQCAATQGPATAWWLAGLAGILAVRRSR